MVRPSLRVISGTDAGHISTCKPNAEGVSPQPRSPFPSRSLPALSTISSSFCPRLQNPFRFTHGD